jgi:SagB-type dehydrogenase family enzyme
MNDTKGATAKHFHNRTKYTYIEHGPGPDNYDILMGEPPDQGPSVGEQNPALEPYPFKRYVDLAEIPLPDPPLETRLPALEAIAGTVDETADAPAFDLSHLGTLLLRTAGLLKDWTNPSGKTWRFRAAGCTGARYHLELYAVTADLDGLNAGVYHYDPEHHALRQLRKGNFRGSVVEATGNNPDAAGAPVLLVCTSEFWRNAWRYQERTYRHAWWDLGTLAANLLPLAASMALPSRVLMGFADDAVNRLVGVDGEKEAALAVFTVGMGAVTPPSIGEPPLVDHAVTPSSSREIDFPDIQRIHRASSLESGEQAARWRSNLLRRTLPEPAGQLTALAPTDPGNLPDESVEDVIVRRRSNRHYAVDEPLPFDVFSTVLTYGAAPVPLDAADPAAISLTDLYLIVNNVEGLSPGKYVLHRDRNAVELLESGNFRDGAAFIAVGQDYARDAHVNIYLMADLDPILEHYGDRGYRLAQFEAALTGGRIQLAAHALRLGAVGSTSADDDVTAFFSPHAAGKSFMFVAVFGVKGKRAS